MKVQENDDQKDPIPMMAEELLALQRHARERARMLAGEGPAGAQDQDAREEMATSDNDPEATGMDQKATS